MHDHLGSPGPLAIIVMGVSGSGKSTLGVALAAEVGCAFLEGDDFHAPEAVARMRAGIPLTDEDRWPWLDRLGLCISGRRPRGTVAEADAQARHYMPPSLLDSQLATLERPQPDELAITLDACRPTAEACQEILAWLSSLPHSK